MPERYDIIVVGGGMLGLSTAYHLAGKGRARWCSRPATWAGARRRPAAGAPRWQKATSIRSISASSARGWPAWKRWKRSWAPPLSGGGPAFWP